MPIPFASFLAGPLTVLALPRLGAARMLSGALALTGMALLVYLVTHQGPPALWLPVLAVMGSVMSALYSRAMTVPVGLSDTIADSLDEALPHS